MKQIYKYPLQITYSQFIRIPKGSEILDIQMQNEVPQIWALVDPEAEVIEIKIEMYGTGEAVVEEEGFQRQFLATVQEVITMYGSWVWHFFMVFETEDQPKETNQ